MLWFVALQKQDIESTKVSNFYCRNHNQGNLLPQLWNSNAPSTKKKKEEEEEESDARIFI